VTCTRVGLLCESQLTDLHCYRHQLQEMGERVPLIILPWIYPFEYSHQYLTLMLLYVLKIHEWRFRLKISNASKRLEERLSLNIQLRRGHGISWPPNVRGGGQGYIFDRNNPWQKHIFLPKTNQNAWFWPNIFHRCYLRLRNGPPIGPAYAFWCSSIFDALPPLPVSINEASTPL